MVDIFTEVDRAFRAAGRARQLTHGLGQSSKLSDVLQVAAGLVTEIDQIQSSLHAARLALAGLAEAAVGDRPGKVRNDAQQTSRATARTITLKTGTQRTRILLHLLRSGPETDWQLQQHLVMAASTERPRRGELVDYGLVYPTAGTRSHDGIDWTVWALTNQGRTIAGEVMAGRSVKLTHPSLITAAESSLKAEDSPVRELAESESGTLF